jgi:hypothetical protein
VRKGFQLAYGLKNMPKPKALLAYGERWKPHRSAGAWYMWRAIELHSQGKLPKRAGRAPRIEQEKPKEAKVSPNAKSKSKAKSRTPHRGKRAPVRAKKKAKSSARGK